MMVILVALRFVGGLNMDCVSANDCSASAATCTCLPQPCKINGRFVTPWPGFKPPGPGGLMKFMTMSKDESSIPPAKVTDTYCMHFLSL